MSSFDPVGGFSQSFLPTYRNFDVDEGQLRLLLTSNHTSIANAVNVKTNGIFELVETLTAEQFFGTGTDTQKKRYPFRKVFSFGAIAAGASLTPPILHGITGITLFTRIYGTCITDQPDYRPIPHASVTANANIEVTVNATNININNGAGGPNITSGIIVLEYLKQ